MTQAVTDMARMYGTTLFGKTFGAPFGEYENCLAVHKVVEVAMLLLFVCHIIYAVILVLAEKTQSQKYLLPKLRDIKEFFSHLHWMMGGKLPSFRGVDYWKHWRENKGKNRKAE